MSAATQKQAPETVALWRAVSIVGSQSGLARMIGVPQSTLNYWLHGAGRVPAEHCLAVARATGHKVRQAHLRPDLFGDKQK